MKKFGKMLGKAFVFCIVMIVLCSFVYPLALTGVSQLTMKNNANGNLIDKNGEPTNNIAVSYTHLDVYKRQALRSDKKEGRNEKLFW